MFINMWLTAVVILCYITPFSHGYIDLANGGGSSFSSAIKGFNYKNKGEEVVLYENDFGQSGYITEQWLTGGPFDGTAIIQVYIDNEQTASLNYYLFMAHSINKDQLHVPWSTRLFGHITNKGAVFNTFRIPFTTAIKITVQNNVTTGPLWYIVRGLTGVDLIIGNFQLPVNSRLNVYKVDEALEPLDFITLSKSTDKSGFLFLVNFNAQSPTPVFLEGCFRALIDSSSTVTFLSSGTEDFFLSAYYFESGRFHGFQSGLTSFTRNTSSTQMFGYKFFVDDPIIFKKSLQLIWRNFETHDGPLGCPSHFPAKPNESPLNMIGSSPAHVKSYVWVYEWPSSNYV